MRDELLKAGASTCQGPGPCDPLHFAPPRRKVVLEAWVVCAHARADSSSGLMRSVCRDTRQMRDELLEAGASTCQGPGPCRAQSRPRSAGCRCARQDRKPFASAGARGPAGWPAALPVWLPARPAPAVAAPAFQQAVRIVVLESDPPPSSRRPASGSARRCIGWTHTPAVPADAHSAAAQYKCASSATVHMRSSACKRTCGRCLQACRASRLRCRGSRASGSPGEASHASTAALAPESAAARADALQARAVGQT